MKNLKALLERLMTHDIDFVLVGGYAAMLHGCTLVTQDVDICISISDQQVGKLREALKDLNPRHRMNPKAKHSFLEYPTDLRGVNNIYLETDLGVLDILSKTLPAGDFEEIKGRAWIMQVYGHSCKIISIDDLIRVKQSMTRAKDKQTVEELKIIKSKLKT